MAWVANFAEKSALSRAEAGQMAEIDGLLDRWPGSLMPMTANARQQRHRKHEQQRSHRLGRLKLKGFISTSSANPASASSWPDR